VPGAKVENVDGKDVITISQSWLTTYLECGEQARRDLYEKVDGTNEQHLIGTTLHAYAAARLQGEDQGFSIATARDVFSDAWHDVRHVNMQKPETAYKYARAAIDLWEKEQYPYIDPLLVEYEMSAIIHCEPGLEVWLSGTPDCVETDREVKDWKTANDWFDELLYQRTDIQSSAYTWLLEVTGYEPTGWFEFWVYNKKAGYSQTVRVFRGPTHWAWLKEQCIQAADNIRNNKAKKWHLNDQSWLCSQKWCPYYSDCKGSLGEFPTKPATLEVGGETTESETQQENE
jgi:hypothetical protein